MARRKRASMREGPLADLFRSTVPEKDEEEPTKQQPVPEASPPSEEPTTFFDREEEATAAPAPQPEPERVEDDERARKQHGRESGTSAAGSEPPDPERVRAYRVDDLPDVPAPKERLSRIFADESHDVEGPAYGREEPGLADYHGPPRPH